MKFFLYSINYHPELTGIGKYNGELANHLLKNNIRVDILTAPPYYPEWMLHENHKNKWSTENGDGIFVYRCPLFVPKNLSIIRRLLHLLSFAISSSLRLFTLLKLKPDVLFLVQPTLFCAPSALLYCKLTGAKSVMHIQDYEVDAMFGLEMVKKGLITRLVTKIESWLMRRFDVVSTISYSMIENAKTKGVSKTKLLLFPNWADINFVTPDIDGSSLKEQWGFSAEDKIVLYAGNIGEKQGLEIVLEAAESFKDNHHLHFVMVGTGAHVHTLKLETVTRGLSNTHFKPLQPWARVPEMLAMADIHLIIQKCGVADVVLPSKLTNILSAGGHAIVTAERHTELGMLDERFPGIYCRIDPEDSGLLVDALNETLGRDLASHNKVAREYAVNFLSKSKILNRFEQDMRRLCSVG